jgi:hypothetical protein
MRAMDKFTQPTNSYPPQVINDDVDDNKEVCTNLVFLLLFVLFTD